MVVGTAGETSGLSFYLKCPPKCCCPPVALMATFLRWVLSIALTLQGPLEGSELSVQLLELACLSPVAER